MPASRPTESLSGTLPWTRSCFVCGQHNPRGFRLRSRVENGVVRLEYTTRETDLGYRHLVHGGVGMTLLDEVMTWAAILAARRACVAAEMTTRLLRPIAVGRRLRVEGRVTGGGLRLLMTEAAIRDESGETLATATGKYMPMRAAEATLCSEDFVAGPEAIPLDRLLDAQPVSGEAARSP
jgi:uncharacterized protein (TIGR00369 family)